MAGSNRSRDSLEPTHSAPARSLKKDWESPGGVVRVGRITTVGFEIVAVVPVQHALGIEPQKALIVLKDVADLAGGQAVPGSQMRKADVLAFAHGQFHQRGFRCAQSRGKLKNAHSRRGALSLPIRARSCGDLPLSFIWAGAFPVPSWEGS